MFFNWRIYLYGAAGALALASATYSLGKHNGKVACNAAHAAADNQLGRERLQADMDAVQAQVVRSNHAGASLASREQANHARTQLLTKEVIKYVPIEQPFINGAGADCQPDAHGVRIWNAANSGTDFAPESAAQRGAGLP
jgi:hypothetical protein